jgi:NAD-reducing hydrogenase large subunit
MLHCVERIEELMADPALYGETIQAKASLNRRVDQQGLMTRANLLIATGQNKPAMNLAVEQAARYFLKPGGAEPEEGILNRLEAAIRCFDPCLSCSTHALGLMPLVVEARGPEGGLRWQIARGS